MPEASPTVLQPIGTQPVVVKGQCYCYGPAIIRPDHTGQRYELELDGLPGSPRKGLSDLNLIYWVVDRWCEANGIKLDRAGAAE